VVQVPNVRVLPVLLERDRETVEAVHGPLIPLTEQDTDDALGGVPGDPVVVVYTVQQNEGMNNAVLWRSHIRLKERGLEVVAVESK
jgi:hypothetical protein